MHRVHLTYTLGGERSHVLDLEDDLHGRSCTPMTLRRADWLLVALKDHFDALAAGDAFFQADRGRTRAELEARYRGKRTQAECYQSIRPGAGSASLPT